ncbi:MAG: glucose-6-phosphate isomerase [Clostridia bacterium]|nr:glucose-6-phosphate isomerase [Clostridia bacterium]
MITLEEKFAQSFIGEEAKQLAPRMEKAYRTLVSATGEGSDFLGWFDLPVNCDKEEISRIKAAAERIKRNSDAVIVIGIGGSYLGARAGVDFIKTPYYNQLAKDTPQVYFLGNSFSGGELETVLELCREKRVAVNVISKSGTTTEPAVAFRAVRDFMQSKYTEEELKERIFVTTDAHRGALLSFARAKGYETFVVPDNVGGRFSVFTAVGLLPLAICGCDIDKLIEGTINERERFLAQGISHPACRYALLRNYFLETGKSCELFVSYDPFLRSYGEWWKQLFGESEGKQNKGVYPTSAVFSTDLHSLGQYVQQGQRILFETVVTEETPEGGYTVKKAAEDLDGLNYLDGASMAQINRKAFTGTSVAHSDGGVPVLEIRFEQKDERSFGELCWFFFAACGVSAYMLGVNPFDQPGVEAYKKNMFALLGKPGYEDLRASIEERIK